MNDFTRWVSAVEAVTGKKRGRHPVFNANQFYPHGVELELRKLTRDEFSRFLSECADAATIGFEDDLNEVSGVPEANPEDVESKLGAAADKVKAAASADFVKWSEMLVGKPYFPPEARDEIFKTWKQNFQILCKSAKADIKKDISLTVQTAKNEGWNKERLRKEITSRLEGKYKARAENIARTELGKLNSAARLSQYNEVGIKYYRWLTTIDGRERQSHRAMNGVICSVSNPNVYYEETPDGLKEHSRTAEMFHGNPGEDFQCRCSMVAWDPEIDGMYEVKDPEAEAEAKRKAEEEERLKRQKEAEEAEEFEEEARRQQAKAEAKFKESLKSLNEDVTELEKMADLLDEDAEYASLTASTILSYIYPERKLWKMGYDALSSDDEAKFDGFREIANAATKYLNSLYRHEASGSKDLLSALSMDAYYVKTGDLVSAKREREKWKKLLELETKKEAEAKRKAESETKKEAESETLKITNSLEPGIASLKQLRDTFQKVIHDPYSVKRNIDIYATTLTATGRKLDEAISAFEKRLSPATYRTTAEWSEYINKNEEKIRKVLDILSARALGVRKLADAEDLVTRRLYTKAIEYDQREREYKWIRKYAGKSEEILDSITAGKFDKAIEMEGRYNPGMRFNVTDSAKVEQLNFLACSEYNAVNRLPNVQPEDEIIKKLAGGDETNGSCFSLAAAYTAQKGGYDVVDYRGECSRLVFSAFGTQFLYNLDKSTYGIIAFSEAKKTSISTGNALKKCLAQAEEGKQFIMVAGQHAAIVKREGKTLYYLELQSSVKNGWQPFKADTLKERFGCTHERSLWGVPGWLYDVDVLKRNPKFIDFMGYINTPVNEQQKGARGSEK